MEMCHLPQTEFRTFIQDLKVSIQFANFEYDRHCHH